MKNKNRLSKPRMIDVVKPMSIATGTPVSLSTHADSKNQCEMI